MAFHGRILGVGCVEVLLAAITARSNPRCFFVVCAGHFSALHFARYRWDESAHEKHLSRETFGRSCRPSGNELNNGSTLATRAPCDCCSPVRRSCIRGVRTYRVWSPADHRPDTSAHRRPGPRARFRRDAARSGYGDPRRHCGKGSSAPAARRTAAPSAAFGLVFMGARLLGGPRRPLGMGGGSL
jgi:hypothetical protein